MLPQNESFIMKLFLSIAQLLPLFIIAVQLWKIGRMLKAIQDDEEPFGEERANILNKRITWIGISSSLIVVLRITSMVLDFFEI